MKVVLDNVRSALNVGSIFRSCDGFGVSELILCGITATPPSREIHKTALGAELTVPFRHVSSTLEAVEELKTDGYTVWAVEQAEGSVWLQNFEASKRVAFVLGNEVEGVSAQVLAVCDGAVEIEQYGSKKSLNVSVAAGIVLWRAKNSSTR